MNTGRYVVLGLAPPRAPWFTTVSRWSTAGSLPIEFVKCVSADDLRARLESGRPFSAAILDGRLPAVDRDLIGTLEERNIAAIVIGADGPHPDWLGLGAVAVLPDDPDRAALLDALAAHGRLIEEVGTPLDPDTEPVPDIGWLGPLVAVIGRSGVGTSTLAAALAQQLARDPRYASDVLLADLVRHAHQAVLHDTRDIVPGIQEVMDLHRSGTPTGDDVRRLTYEIPERGYRLLLGLRNPRDWVTIRARALSASLESLRRMSRIVIADTDPELEGEAETGSFDIEDRHLLGRRTTAVADLVVVVATPSLTGLHRLAQQIEELRGHGTPGRRLLVTINRAPRSARSRAELSRVVTELTRNRDHPDPHLGPIFVPDRRGTESAHRDFGPIHHSIGGPLAAAVLRALERTGSDGHELGAPIDEEPVRVEPGSLGTRPEDAP